MNSLLLQSERRQRSLSTGALLAFFSAVAGGGPTGRVLWRGTVADIREGTRINADVPESVPTTDDGMADLLRYARPALRRHGFIFAPLHVSADGVVTIKRKPKGYRTEWEKGL